MKKVWILLMTLMLMLALASCGGGAGNDDGAAADQNEMISVTVEIDYPDDSDAEDVEDVVVEIPKDGTVMDALNAYADDADCEVLMDQSSSTAYVTSIGGVAAGGSSGWTYEVNDEQVMEAADACVLKDGDEVSWSFETWGD